MPAAPLEPAPPAGPPVGNAHVSQRPDEFSQPGLPAVPLPPAAPVAPSVPSEPFAPMPGVMITSRSSIIFEVRTTTAYELALAPSASPLLIDIVSSAAPF